MARTPNSVGFQPRTTPAERRADLDLRRLIAEYRAEQEADVAALEARLDTAEADIVRLETAKCQVTRSATQSIANNTNTLVSFDTENYDPLNWFSSGAPTQVVPNVLGLYQVTAVLEWGADSDYTRRLIDIQRNGVVPTNPMLRDEMPNNYVFDTPHSLTTPLILMNGTTDYFSLRPYQTNTSAGANTVVAAMLVELKVPL